MQTLVARAQQRSRPIYSDNRNTRGPSRLSVKSYALTDLATVIECEQSESNRTLIQQTRPCGSFLFL